MKNPDHFPGIGLDFSKYARILYVMARTRCDLGPNRFGLVDDL